MSRQSPTISLPALVGSHVGGDTSSRLLTAEESQKIFLGIQGFLQELGPRNSGAIELIKVLAEPGSDRTSGQSWVEFRVRVLFRTFSDKPREIQVIDDVTCSCLKESLLKKFQEALIYDFYEFLEEFLHRANWWEGHIKPLPKNQTPPSWGDIRGGVLGLFKQVPLVP